MSNRQPNELVLLAVAREHRPSQLVAERVQVVGSARDFLLVIVVWRAPPEPAEQGESCSRSQGMPRPRSGRGQQRRTVNLNK